MPKRGNVQIGLVHKDLTCEGCGKTDNSVEIRTNLYGNFVLCDKCIEHGLELLDDLEEE